MMTLPQSARLSGVLIHGPVLRECGGRHREVLLVVGTPFRSGYSEDMRISLHNTSCRASGHSFR